LVKIVTWIADDSGIGLAQFIAGIKGFEARDTLVTVINTMWGSFWLAIGILYAFTVRLIARITLGVC
jgi:succinate-acetate transporter protein